MYSDSNNHFDKKSRPFARNQSCSISSEHIDGGFNSRYWLKFYAMIFSVYRKIVEWFKNLPHQISFFLEEIFFRKVPGLYTSEQSFWSNSCIQTKKKL